MTKSIKQKVALAIAVVPMLALAACSQSNDTASSNEQVNTSEQMHGDEAFETSSNNAVVFDFSGPVSTYPGQSLEIELPETIRVKTPEGKKQPVESYTLTPRSLDSLKLCAADLRVKWVNDQVPENVWTVRRQGKDYKGKTYKVGETYKAEGPYNTRWDVTVTKPMAFASNRITYRWGLDTFNIGKFNSDSPEKGIYVSDNGHEAVVVNNCSEDLEDTFVDLNFTDPNRTEPYSEGAYIFAGAKVSVLTDGTMRAEEDTSIRGYKQDSSGSWIEN